MPGSITTTPVNPSTIVRVAGYGGFPVESIGYWKVCHVSDPSGEKIIIHIQFKTGGFLEIPADVMTEDEFVSLVYGIPF